MKPTFLTRVLIAVTALAISGLRAEEPNIRVCIQLIELPHLELTKLLGNTGAKTHPAAIALIREGKAKLIDSSVMTSIPNQKATVASIGERIYPTEFDPDLPRFQPPRTPPNWLPAFPVFHLGRPAVPAAWDIRNTGMTFESESSYDEPLGKIAVRLAPEWVGMTTPTTWVEYVDEWGDASDRHPTFTSLGCTTHLTLVPGRFALVVVLTPQPEPPPPAVARKVLVFARADLPQQ